MKWMVSALVLGLVALSSTVSAQPVRWTTYSIPQTGTSVPGLDLYRRSRPSGRVRTAISDG